MIDVAKRLTAASFLGVGRAIGVQLHAGCPGGVGRLHGQTIKGGLVYLLKPAWREKSINEVVHDRSGYWFEVRQTATGSMARCTLTSS